MPLLVRDELVGVLCLESEMRYRFHEEDKQSIELLGSYLAVAIQNMQMHERASERSPRLTPALTRAGGGAGASPPASRRTPTRARLLRRRRVHPGRR